MDDAEKRLFDALEKLREGAWQRFDSRRAYEWKAGLGIWGGLGALIGILATNAQPCLPTASLAILIAAVVLVACMHSKWLSDLGKRNRDDKGRAIAIEAAMIRRFEEIDIEAPESAPDPPEVPIIKLQFSWSHIGQAGFTWILSAAAVAVLVRGICSPPEQQPEGTVWSMELRMTTKEEVDK